jgi:hypothetical protein
MAILKSMWSNLTLLLLIMAVVGLAQPHSVGAATGKFSDGFNTVTTIRADNTTSTTDLPGMIILMLKAVLSLIAVIAVAAVIYGGFLYLTSLGNEKKAETAKRVILYAIIGLVIIGLAGVIVNFFIKGFIG